MWTAAYLCAMIVQSSNRKWTTSTINRMCKSSCSRTLYQHNSIIARLLHVWYSFIQNRRYSLFILKMYLWSLHNRHLVWSALFFCTSSVTFMLFFCFLCLSTVLSGARQIRRCQWFLVLVALQPFSASSSSVASVPAVACTRCAANQDVSWND